ncbi:hypothetical protein K4F52_010272 [Lecanicillium sp. MT-2017a]|nr:hypothetical protein K4F52_010272 [Lecanicillium sp. MT-2017a]
MSGDNFTPAPLLCGDYLEAPPVASDPPPPYHLETDENALDSAEKGTASPATHQASQASPNIPGGHWDLVCNIGVTGRHLVLDGNGNTAWSPGALAVDGEYFRSGFSVTLGAPHVSVTNGAYKWKCDTNTDAGQLLVSKRDTVSLKNLADRLFVFEQTSMRIDRDRPRSKSHDPKGCLSFKTQSHNIWTITGTDIYQVEGNENDVVVRTPEFLRLWDMDSRKFRWEREDRGEGRIWGFSKKYVVKKAGSHHMYERKTGLHYGRFDLPLYSAFIDFNEENHFGPTVGDREVDLRIWETTDKIQGYLLLRGGLDNLDVQLIGQKPTWTRHQETVSVYKYSFIKKRLV